MARLKGIAHGLLGTFISRNNDVDRYWGIGVLRLYADSNGISEITIDLENPESSTDSSFLISSVRGRYREWLINALNKSGVKPSQLTKAQIKLRFSNFVELPGAIRETRGEPYVCTVTLTGDNGVTYALSKTSCGAPHDPRWELRSTRAV
jgi:hypothetical protein